MSTARAAEIARDHFASRRLGAGAGEQPGPQLRRRGARGDRSAAQDRESVHLDGRAGGAVRAALRLADVVRVPVATASRRVGGPLDRRRRRDGARAAPRLPRGQTLSGSRHLSRRTIAGIGLLAARVDLALADFADAGADRTTQWDLRHAPDVVAELLAAVPDPALRARLEEASASAWAAVAPLAAALGLGLRRPHRRQRRRGRPHSAVPDGVIDLGDLATSWRAGELAITLSSLLHHDGVEATTPSWRSAPIPPRCPRLRGLGCAVAARGAPRGGAGRERARRARDRPGLAYAAENLAHERAIFDAATSVPLRVGMALVRRAAGVAVDDLALPTHGPLLDAPAGDVVTLDLSATGLLLPEGAGSTTRPRRTSPPTPRPRRAVVATRFGEPRLTRSRPGKDEPLNVVPGIELTAHDPVELFAPWAARASVDPDGLELVAADGIRLAPRPPRRHLMDSRAAADLTAGEPLGSFSGTLLMTVDDGTDLRPR